MSVQVLQTSGVPEAVHRMLIAQTVNELLKGRANNVGSITLAANVTTTAIADARIKATMTAVLIARTANAAAATANVYISAVVDGSITLTHANAATTDRTFDYVIHGG